MGANRVFRQGDKEYHLQAEDLGLEQAHFEVRVYEQGTVLWRKRVPYQEVLDQNLPRLEMEEAVRSLMDKTLHTVEAAIARGRLQIAGQ